MIKIHILKSGRIENLIGPTGTIMRLLDNRQLLKSKGYDLHIFTSESVKVKKSNGQQQTRDLKQPKILIKQRFKNKLQNSYFLSLMMAIRSLYNARKFIKTYLESNPQCEIIQFHDIFVAMEYVRQAHQTLPKTFLFFHNDGRRLEMFYQNFPKLRNSIFSKYLEKRFETTVLNMTQLVFISDNGKFNFINEHPKFDPSKITVIHNGIYDLPNNSTTIFKKTINNNSEKIKMVSVGTVNQRKGQREIIKAVSMLSKRIQNKLEIHIIGDGPDIPIIRESIKSYELHNIVRLRGGMDRADVITELSKANIYILFSKYEGLPISIIEAMRSGLPIISTRIAGIPELVENNLNGVLINPNVDELKRVLENIESIDWYKFGKNSRSIFEKKFTFQRMLELYINLLNRINDSTKA